MDSSEDVRGRWAEGLRAAASRAYAAGHGTEPPEPRPTRWRLDARTAATAAAVLALVGACAWWGLRPSAPPPIAVAPASKPSVSASTPLVLHVSGAVERPGLVELAPGARLVEAVEAAGGMVADADESSVNLAREAVDGEHVVVARMGEDDASGPLDVNAADAARLESLPGVGPVLAARIVADRDANGPFASVEDLGRVSGVGPAILSAIADLATT
ncbi:ComEA family DNA-binding protein [Demequina sp.]|uniref:ComEA family DNA-binding protein n=1 Tax=Demequina sp. TaxID=2050685 RepID=UPI0025ED936B|nr:ComEA family DNA-binding protein [Demequina sp.]